MDKKLSETQQIADEQLDDVVGGSRDNVYLKTSEHEVVEFDDGGEETDSSPSWIVMCPRCRHTLRNCTCAR